MKPNRLALRTTSTIQVIKFRNWWCEHLRTFHDQILRCHLWLKLDLEKSCNELCLKLSKTLGIFSKFRHCLSVDTLIMLYYSPIYTFHTYGIQVWGLAYPTYLKPVTTLQKRVVWILTFSDVTCFWAIAEVSQTPKILWYNPSWDSLFCLSVVP